MHVLCREQSLCHSLTTSHFVQTTTGAHPKSPCNAQIGATLPTLKSRMHAEPTISLEKRACIGLGTRLGISTNPRHA